MKQIVLLGMVCTLLLSGCATILEGDHRGIRFHSQPEGAEVFINGTSYGRTPLNLELKAGKSYTIEFRKPGYRTEIRQIDSRIDIKWLVIDVICGAVPVVVDAITGAWCEFDQKFIHSIMEREDG